MNIEELSFDLDEKSVENFKKAINYDEIEARHKRFMNGTETIDDLINGILHYRIKNDDDLDLDVVEFKYYQKMIDLYEKEKEKNKELEYIIASNTTREVITNLKNSRKSREDLEMLDLGWKEELKEKFQNTRNEILSETLIKVTDRYWMDKCLEYINNLEKELIGEE